MTEQAKYDPQAIEPEVAAALGAGPALPLQSRLEQAEILRADDAALSQRRPAHRSLVRHDALGRARPLHAHEGLQRPVPDGLRRLRPARRERRHPARHPPGDVDARQHRADARAAAQHGHDVRLGARSRKLRAGILSLDGMVLQAVLRERAGVSQRGAGQLVADAANRAGERAGDRRQGRAHRAAGRPEAADAVVLPHDQVRRRTAGIRRSGLPRADQDDADQLDRAERRRARDLPHRAGRSPD